MSESNGQKTVEETGTGTMRALAEGILPPAREVEAPLEEALPEVPEADAARRWKGPLPDREHLTMHREDMLAARLADLEGVLAGQSLIIAKYQLDEMKRRHDEELRKLREQHALQVGTAQAELALLSEAAKTKDTDARRVWEDLSLLYGVDFKSHGYDDDSGVVLLNGSPVRSTSKEKS